MIKRIAAVLFTALFCLPVVAWAEFPTTGVLDNFNRTNEGPPPSANWTADTQFKVLSNVCAGNGTSNWGTWNTSYAPNEEVYMTITTLPDVNEVTSMGCRLDIVNYDSYYIRYVRLAGTDTVNITHYNSGNDTDSILATYSQEIAVNDSIGISAIGSTITAYYKAADGSWVELGNVTEPSLNATGYLFIEAKGTIRVDDFGGGNYTVSAPSTESPTGQIIFID